jgi:hypothetical protein
LYLCLTALSYTAYGQKDVTKQNLVWYGYYFTIQFNEKWYLQSEIQERHYINPVAQHQTVLRSHIHRTLKNNWETSTGMCLFLQSPNDPHSNNRLIVPELRPHIEFTNKQKYKYFTLDHRYRAEARIFHNTNAKTTELEDGYAYSNFRLRYNLQATLPVWKIDEQRALKIKFGNEIMLNAGKKIVKNVFDQNRIYAALSIDLLPSLTFDAGYMNWFQQRPSGSFFNRHIIRFTVFQKINLIKNKKS